MSGSSRHLPEHQQLVAAAATGLVTLRSRRATAIRLSAPFIFLALALIVTLALNINYGLRAQFIAVLPGQEVPDAVEGIPECGRDVYIAGRECLDFLYTPAGDPIVEVSPVITKPPLLLSQFYGGLMCGDHW
jgi:hypothetical protein